MVRNSPPDLCASPAPRLDEIDIKKFLVKPRFVFGLLCQLFLMMSLQYLAPNIALELRKYGYS